MAVNTQLLADIKNYLDITWTDDDTDGKLIGIIERGRHYVNRIGGTSYDFALEGAHRQLLFDYCRYVRSNALEDFEKNFLHEIMALQIDGQVKGNGC